MRIYCTKGVIVFVGDSVVPHCTDYLASGLLYIKCTCVLPYHRMCTLIHMYIGCSVWGSS